MSNGKYKASLRRKSSDYMDEVHKVRYNDSTDRERNSYNRAREPVSYTHLTLPTSDQV